jgi:hypothetical protein
MVMEILIGAVVGLLGGYVVGSLLCGPAWLVAWHGEGEPHQHQFYRCLGCRRLLSWRHIQSGGCPCRESIKVSPAVLTRSEKARALWLPFTVTPWMVRRAALTRLAQVAAREAARATR